MQYYFDV